MRLGGTMHSQVEINYWVHVVYPVIWLLPPLAMVPIMIEDRQSDPLRALCAGGMLVFYILLLLACTRLGPGIAVVDWKAAGWFVTGAILGAMMGLRREGGTTQS